MNITDEMLMAYADEALDREQRAVVEAELATSEPLRKRLRAFVLTGEPVRRSYAPIASAPMPPRLVEAVMRGPIGRPAGRPVPQPAPLASRLAELFGFGGSISAWGGAFAGMAAAVAGVAVFAGWFATAPSHTIVAAQDFLVQGMAGAPLAGALERTPSGADAAVPLAASSEFKLRPVFSFAAQKGGYCRQYVLTSAAQRFEGIACRQPGGTWQVPALVAGRPQSGSPSSATVRPAGHGENPEIDAHVEALIDGDVLGTAEEAKVIANNWAGAGNK